MPFIFFLLLSRAEDLWTAGQTKRGGRRGMRGAGKADTVGFFERDSQRGTSFLAPTKPPTPRSTFFIPDHLVRSSRPRPRCVSDNSLFLFLSLSTAICSRDWLKKRWSRCPTMTAGCASMWLIFLRNDLVRSFRVEFLNFSFLSAFSSFGLG